MSSRNYADSHRVLRVSTKRFFASPFLDRYLTDEAVFGIYSGRLYPLSLGADPVADYWVLRRQAALFDVPERPIEIVGPDAEQLLDLVLTRDVSKVGVGKACYGIACNDRGGIMMDGVLIRHERDRFWYVVANGDFDSWLDANALGLDVRIRCPGSYVVQVQGPTSLDVLAAACDGGPPIPFDYYAVATVRMDGQQVLVTRTGWSGELGFEIYTSPEVDGGALWDHLVAAGEPHGLAVQSLESLGIRRIEAGILDNGTDLDSTMTPYEAGLGRFVDLEKVTFRGRDALAAVADRRQLLLGISSPTAVPVAEDPVCLGGEIVGTVTTGAWSPFLEVGVGYVRLRDAGLAVGTEVTLGEDEAIAEIAALPFSDAERRVARGLPR